MKKICFLIIAILASVCMVAQTPQAFKYQAIARDEAGNILSNWEIGMKVSIIQGGHDGQDVYIETHQVTSNIYGMINLVIGKGNVQKGDFNSISWGQSSHSIKVELDIDGGSNYKETGTSQLYAVPYALYAEQAGSVIESSSGSGSGERGRVRVRVDNNSSNRNGTPNSKFPAGTSSYLNVNVGNVGIGTTDPQEKLDVVGKIMSSEGYNTNGNDGLSDTLNLVSHIDFDNSKLKYRTLVHSGGILTYISDTSAWVDTVGNNILPFTCGDSLFDSRDGQKYATVQIGTQCWMAQNINIGTRINGTENPTDPDGIEKYCYDDNEDYCDTLGGLYQWDEIMQYVTDTGAQGICPSGWHIPSDEEWKILEGTVDSFYPVGDLEWNETSWRGLDAGENLKSTSGWDGDGNGTDFYGFTALPGGNKHGDGSFKNIGVSGEFWSSTLSTSYPWDRNLYNILNSISRLERSHNLGYSVRCIKD